RRTDFLHPAQPRPPFSKDSHPRNCGNQSRQATEKTDIAFDRETDVGYGGSLNPAATWVAWECFSGANMRKTGPVLTPSEPGRRSTQEGFTIVELLVVVGIIGILASLLLSSLASAKAKAQSLSCMSNQRQLILAWMLYADDNNDALPYNLGDDD